MAYCAAGGRDDEKSGSFCKGFFYVL